ncbi:MAG TPA: hypothetical protein VFO30_05130 [Chthoniobacterales bacterium]|nr:hypothetical protein [Chthoniobacterales bacterium]
MRAEAGNSSDHFDRHFHRSDDQKIDDEEEGRHCERGRVRFAERIAEEEEGGEEGSRNLSDRIAYGDRSDRIACRDAVKARLRRAENCI